MSVGERELGSMYSRQDDLPPLPVPDLQQSLQKYLAQVKAVCSPEIYANTVKIVEEFGKEGGEGEDLHNKLLDFAEGSRNWLEKWWEDFAYLYTREPSAIKINWYGVLPIKDWRIDYSRNAQVSRAALVINMALQFATLVRDQKLEGQEMAGQPLCMYQYSRMFAGCKVPGEPLDALEVYDDDSRYICVMKRGHIYKVEVLYSDGSIASISDLEEQMSFILERDRTRGYGPCVGALSSATRTTFAQTREIMINQDNTNLESFETIQKSLFVFIYDEEEPKDYEEVAYRSLTGDGRNRFFDKPVQIMLYKNGLAGFNGEHAYADAMVGVHYGVYLFDRVTEAIKDLDNGKLEKGAVTGRLAKPQPVRWTISPNVEDTIEYVIGKHKEAGDNIDMKWLDFTLFGKHELKKSGLHPDAFIQCALQLTYYRLHQVNPPTYETAHTRLFYHGRTETTRSCTLEMVEMTRSWENASHDQKFALLQSSGKQHMSQMKDNMTGQGSDRHLMGLQIVAGLEGRFGEEAPEIFNDPAWKLSGGGGNFILSTSLIGYHRLLGGFSPMCAGGYGVCYAIRDDAINFSITSFVKDKGTSSNQFRSMLMKCMYEVWDVCKANKAKKDATSSKM